jgi:hypothetical protein
VLYNANLKLTSVEAENIDSRQMQMSIILSAMCGFPTALQNRLMLMFIDASLAAESRAPLKTVAACEKSEAFEISKPVWL